MFPRLHLSARRLAPLAAGGATLAAIAAVHPAPAAASHTQSAMFVDGNALQGDPAGTLDRMRALGATTARVVMYWSAIAPHATSTKRPKFDATDPNAYPAKAWAPYDAIVRDAKADGIRIDLTVAGGSPRWASGAGAPQQNPAFAWKPNAAAYGQFMQAVGRRYSGSFRPRGAKTALPRVSFWALWNEPNFGEDLGPQATDTSRISYAPGMYRNLVRNGWSALRRTGHTPKHDTIVIGELAAHGSALSDGRHGATWPQGLPGDYGQTQPLPFLDTLYCLDARGHKLTGHAAKVTGCPTTPSARARFVKTNPGLFEATGVGDHPYANDASPVSDGKGDPNWATFPNFSRLERTIDRANRAYGSHHRLAIYNDEYGYITNPPQTNPGQAISPAKAARYLNWAEYLSWRNPRVATYSQYLLNDPPPNPANGNAGFASGLYTTSGKAKATVDAYRLPLWVPSATLRRAGRTTVWGEARPSHWTTQLKRAPAVQIQFEAHGRGGWKTLTTLHTRTYFESRPKLTTSGDLRLRYVYPRDNDPFMPLGIGGLTITSRAQPVTVR